MTKPIFIAAAAVLALSACGTKDNGSNAQDLQSEGAVDRAGSVDDPGVAQAEAQPADNTHLYVANAAISDIYEIESSRLALAKSQSAGVKALAKQMIADHTATTNALKPLAAQPEVGRALPTEPDPRHQALLDTLKATSAGAFNKAYLEQQASAHQEALLLHGNYAEQGDKAAVKAFAKATVPKIQHHADMLKQLGSGGSTGN
jgi:putative membrane protein